MLRKLALAVPSLLVAGAAVAAEPSPATPAAVSVNPRALELFERDWALMDWALRAYDANRDVELSRAEASAAAEGFRKMADADGDGRVTPAEYGAAREFILARY